MPRFSSPILTLSVGDLSVQCDDEHHRLVINGRVPSLSRMEYALMRELLIHQHEWRAGRRASRYISGSVLLASTGAKSMQALYRLVSDARLKLRTFELDVECRWGQGYYVPEA